MRITAVTSIALAFTLAMSALVGAGPASAATTPVASDDYYSVAAGEKLAVRGIGLLANDSDASSSIAVLAGDGPHNGGVGVAGNRGEGEFYYAPSLGYVGFDSFTYCLVSLLPPQSCGSNVATVIIRVGEPTVSRVGGSDRFEVASKVAEFTNPTSSTTVFIASGENFPDALSAAPAAGKFGSAMLLVSRSEVPLATRNALARLGPTDIVLVGGPVAISESVAVQLQVMLPPGGSVTRTGGLDRYAVSRSVAAQLFKVTPHTFTATGANFPDALAAGAAAAAAREPVLLINGSAAAADEPTQGTLLNLSTSAITIVGGAQAVSTGVEGTLRGIATVDRIGGADRYQAAVNVAKKTFGASETAYIATGMNFPDALVGASLAGRRGSPLYLAPGSCVPTAVLADLARIGAGEIVLLGGERALSSDVAALKHC